MAEQRCFDIKIGKCDIGLGAEHWAIKIDDRWYEVNGAGKKQTGEANQINVHQNDSKYKQIIHIQTCSAKAVGAGLDLHEWVEKWNEDWLQRHPIYAVNGSNCQMYVKHIVKDICGVDVDTQNKNLGNIAIGAGIGAMVVGAFALGFGFILRGTHK